MSLTSKEKAKKSLVLGTYIIAGGVSSVLILFLLRKSFFLDSQSATKYHRDIDVALDEVHKLEHNFLTSQFNTLNPEIADELDILEDSLKSQIDVVKQSLTALKATPHFLSQQQQDQIKNNLKNQEILLASRYQAIKHLYNNQAVFHQSCAKASSLKQELVDNQGTVSLNLVGD
ncbi:MAG: hypothetical protein RLZZ74_2065, partial [Cyanobacteriota bacterium]